MDWSPPVIPCGVQFSLSILNSAVLELSLSDNPSAPVLDINGGAQGGHALRAAGMAARAGVGRTHLRRHHTAAPPDLLPLRAR